MKVNGIWTTLCRCAKIDDFRFRRMFKMKFSDGQMDVCPEGHNLL